MVKKRQFAAVLALMMLTCIMFAPVSALADTNKAVLDACNSVVRLYTESEAVYEAYTGTGFAVGPADRPVELIVTNCHVIMDSAGNLCDGIYVVLDSLDDLDSVVEAEVLVYDETIDYAILAIEPTMEREPIALMSASQVERTERVYALGFPAVSDSIDDRGDSLPSTVDDVTITNGVVSKINAVSDGASYIQSDCTINSGNSGGPLITSDGVCIGINTFSAVEGEGTYGSIYIDYVIEELVNAGVPYIDGTAANKAAVASANVEAASAGGIGEIGTLGVILLGIVAVVFVVSYVFMVKRNNGSKGDVGYTKKAVPLPPEEMAKVIDFTPCEETRIDFTLKCTTGVFAGKTFPVDGNVYIGRDPAICNIVLPNGTPGISSIHCKVVAAEDGLFLTDLDSTYGTFLSDGTRLEANKAYPIARGQGFYLAAEANSYLVM